jgi:Cu-Zn family superoxide dismutase
MKKVLIFVSLFSAISAISAEIEVSINFTAAKGVGQAAGKVIISETEHGLLFTPKLQGVAPGMHGFHVHAKGSCDKNGMDAGGHFDPKKTGKHLGPYKAGHLGDLPGIFVNSDKTATMPVLAPQLKSLKDINGLALMIHEGGDNYSDKPKELGGGGKRMLCGIINVEKP